MLSKLQKEDVELKLETLPQMRTFNMAASLPDGKQPTLVCHQAVTEDPEQRIRHGSALIRRGIRWLVTKQFVGEPLLGRLVFESLCNGGEFHCRDFSRIM